jgi:hypothetical protein
MDIAALNSATKYPSIMTYHELDGRGRLQENLLDFAKVDDEEDVIWTEKVDGTNGRIVVLPDGDYFIGKREELIYAKGDRIHNKDLGIMQTLKPIADRIVATGHHPALGSIVTYFLEVYGGTASSGSRQYTEDRALFGARLFDMAVVDLSILERPLDQISSWREHEGPMWFDEEELQDLAPRFSLPLAPRLGTVKASALPKTPEGTHEWLTSALPSTHVALSDGAKGQAEGIVLRTKDRSVIAKARFQDYEKALGIQSKGKR